MKTSIFIMTFLMSIVTSYAQDATAIVQKANDLVMGKTSKGLMTMTIERPTWSRTVSMKSWSQGNGYYLILITEPARDKGQVFLKRETDMWNWMPTISRMIKIPPSMMSQSWMGSDFTNDDLVKMNSIVEDYTHKIIGEEKIGDYDCYKIELIPKENAAVVWGKIIMWVEKKEFYEMKMEYFDEDMNLVNTQTASNVTQFGDRKLPAHLEMIPADKKGHKTIMDMKDMEFNTDIPDSFFSQQNMKRVK
ncbi:MAG: outer membrane lipoprotein-sorting protein [Bacteroidetes bacterium 4572_114]|nr:MAG: outer membrane lipoprotein-sorting protein [Bacteroidetes bacterium 4572_114]